MKVIPSSFPLLREAKVVNVIDPENLGRVQLRVYPELSEISPESDLPWAFPASGGIHGKSFGLPLKDQIITCFCWSRFWNEFSFLPFNITNPTEHLFTQWKEDQKPKITDMKDDPEEEHFVVKEYEDGFTEFHDTKNGQHGYLHPAGTYTMIDTTGTVYSKLVEKFVMHNEDNTLRIVMDAKSGDIAIQTKGKVTEQIDDDFTQTIKKNSTILIEGETTITVKDKTTIIGEKDMILNGKGNVLLEAGNELKLKGITVKADGVCVPKGKGPFCARPFCLATGAPHATDTVDNAI
jgi:hypothetical protein